MGERKYKIIMIFSIMLMVVIGILFIFASKRKFNPEIIYGDIILKGTENEYGDKENLSYHTTTGAPEDVDVLPVEVTNKVLLYGEDILLNNQLDTYGINSLPEYLLRYFNYYIGEGIFKVTVIANSYQHDVNFPSFKIKTEDANEYVIKCIYRRADQRYDFICEDIN